MLYNCKSFLKKVAKKVKKVKENGIFGGKYPRDTEYSVIILPKTPDFSCILTYPLLCSDFLGGEKSFAVYDSMASDRLLEVEAIGFSMCDILRRVEKKYWNIKK